MQAALEQVNPIYVIVGIVGVVIIGGLIHVGLNRLGEKLLSALDSSSDLTDNASAVSGSTWLNSIMSSPIAMAVGSLRQLGFFADRTEVTDAALAREIDSAIAQALEQRGFDAAVPGRTTGWLDMASRYSMRMVEPHEIDLLLLSEDPTRLWWKSLDQVRDGHNAYVRLLNEWAGISRGAFQPRDITESWGEDGESVIVSFDLDGAEQIFVHLTGHDTMLDTAGLRALINPLIADTGIQFEIVDVHHMPNIVIALTAEERATLENVRGWSFAEITAVLI